MPTNCPVLSCGFGGGFSTAKSQPEYETIISFIKMFCVSKAMGKSGWKEKLWEFFRPNWKKILSTIGLFVLVHIIIPLPYYFRSILFLIEYKQYTCPTVAIYVPPEFLRVRYEYFLLLFVYYFISCFIYANYKTIKEYFKKSNIKIILAFVLPIPIWFLGYYFPIKLYVDYIFPFLFWLSNILEFFYLTIGDYALSGEGFFQPLINEITLFGFIIVAFLVEVAYFYFIISVLQYVTKEGWKKIKKIK